MSENGSDAGFPVRNVGILATCQALSMSGTVLIAAVSALVGESLSVDKSLATLPLAVMFVATMFATIPASILMGRIGWKAGFMMGQLIGVAGAALSIVSIITSDFWLFTMAGILIGVHNAFYQFFRFAAAETAKGKFQAKAISFVLAGGVIAAVAGPQLGKWTIDFFDQALFAGGYLAIVVLDIVTFSILIFARLPKPEPVSIAIEGRPLKEIIREPVFMVAITSAAVGYAIMTLVMTATPLAMKVCGFEFDHSATVIQWHVLAMFLPSFFTGYLITKFGVVRIIIAGILLETASMMIALSGVGLLHFSFSLVALGLGWNFMFLGGTTLLSQSIRPGERAKIQALNDFLVFGGVAFAGLSSGALSNSFGWSGVTAAMSLPLLIAFMMTVWYQLQLSSSKNNMTA